MVSKRLFRERHLDLLQRAVITSAAALNTTAPSSRPWESFAGQARLRTDSSAWSVYLTDLLTVR